MNVPWPSSCPTCCRTEHYAVVLHAGDMPAAMESITWHMDDPRVGMCHQNWYVAKLASRFVKVCLAGVGGDELFAGYPWRYRAGINAGNDDAHADALFKAWHRLLPPDELPLLFSPDIRRSLGSARTAFDTALAKCGGQSGTSTPDRRLRRALEFEYHTFLNGLLITEDRISMAHSLETRVPFLDNDLASLAWRIPSEHKLDPQWLANQKQRTHREHGGQARPSASDDPAAARGIHDPAQAGLLSAGCELVPRPLDGLHQAGALRSQDARTPVVRPRPGGPKP